MTIEEKKQVGKYMLQMANFLADGCYQQEMLLKAAHIIDEALKQESNGDMISRQIVFEQINCWISSGEYKYTNATDYLIKRIRDMSSVTPQPKIGHWIIIDDCEQFIAKCSECGRIEDSRMIDKYPYCHCGIKMRR